jgi:myosin heavy subunit
MGILEEERDQCIKKIINILQGIGRGYCKRKEYKIEIHKREFIPIMQRNFKKYLFFRDWTWYYLVNHTKRFIWRESYKLDYIGEVELGENKNENPYDTFKEFYSNDYQRFVEYNIQDVELVDKLEDKMQLIALHLTMAYDAKVNYQDVFGQVRIWDTIIYNHLRSKNIVPPS